MNTQRLAAHLMIGQAVFFAAETAVIHGIGSHLSIVEIALMRGVGGIALAFCLAWKAGFNALRTHQLSLQLLRGAVTFLYLSVMIYSFSQLPFADAAAISYTQAAYIAVFSVLILREPATASSWAAAAVSITGALLIAKPSLSGWSVAHLVALLGTSLNGLAFVLNRYLQRNDPEATTMLYANAVTVMGTLPLLAITRTPILGDTVWLPCLLVLGPIGMYLGIAAVRHASASVLGPYTLLRLVVSAVASVMIFHEMPDAYSTCGLALIVASCVLSSCSLSSILPEPIKNRLCRTSITSPTATNLRSVVRRYWQTPAVTP